MGDAASDYAISGGEVINECPVLTYRFFNNDLSDMPSWSKLRRRWQILLLVRPDRSL